MTVFLFLMLQHGIPGADPGFITETEIYSGLQDYRVFIRPNGEVYMLNSREKRIQHYAADGTLIRYIGRKGNGPGEFVQPTHFFVNDEGVFLQDLGSGLISQFKLDGSLVVAYRASEAGLTLVRTIGGWFFFKSDVSLKEGPIPGELYWSGDNFQSQRVVASIENVGEHGVMLAAEKKVVRGLYRPVNTMPMLIVSPDQTKLFVTHGEGLAIEVYDGSTGERLMTTRKETRLIPFDEAWADEYLESRLEGAPDHFRNANFIKDYPKFFPVIRFAGFDPAGNLVIDRWQRPYEQSHLIAFDQSGQEVPVRFSWEAFRRCVGVANGHAYILMFGSEEEAGLAKVPVEQIEEFVKQYPTTDVKSIRIPGVSSE